MTDILIPAGFLALGISILGAGIMAQFHANKEDFNTSAIALVIGVALVIGNAALAVLT